jgi:beta-N-acetylhexosaminidase
MDNIGQLIITGIKGKSLTPEERSFIQEGNIGGVVLFAYNYESPGQLAELVNSIQALRSEHPLFISVDHEGGRVQRFKAGFTHFPPMLEIAEKGSPKLCFEVHQAMALELLACGVNLNFSPVCDVFSNPSNKVIGDRAFGKTPERVEQYISSAIRGLQTGGIIACAKHFPGHGSTTKDSHFDLPYITSTIEELEERDIPPFIKAVKSRVEMVMMGHLVVDAIDPELPCSMSPKAHDYLRKKLKFSNVIISDDLHMKAIDDHYSPEDAAIKILKAGTDILLYREPERAEIALEAIKRAKSQQQLSLEELTAKIKRIWSIKNDYFGEYAPIYIPNISKKMLEAKGAIILDQINKKSLEDLS